MNSDTGAAPPAMTVAPFPDPESQEPRLPQRLDQALAKFEPETLGDLDHLSEDSRTSLTLLADVAAGKEYVTTGPTGKRLKLRPDLGERLRAAQVLLKLIGDVTSDDALIALGLSKRGQEEISPRQLARACASAVIEWQHEVMRALPQGTPDRAATAAKLCAMMTARYAEARGAPIEVAINEMMKGKSNV